MKTTIYIFLSLFLCCTTKLNAQGEIHIDTLSVNYFNGITQQIQIVDEYRITNLSDEDYLTWVAFFQKGNKSNKELVHTIVLDNEQSYSNDHTRIQNYCEFIRFLPYFSSFEYPIKEVKPGPFVGGSIIKSMTELTIG